MCIFNNDNSNNLFKYIRTANLTSFFVIAKPNHFI